MKPLVLMILDGFGYNESDYGNAIRAARMPNLDRIKAESPMTIIGASGLDVGLPAGQMGNSEVGHTNIGAAKAAPFISWGFFRTAESTATSTTFSPSSTWRKGGA